MYWDSLSDFLAMGHHGLYVWGSFIVMAVAMIAEPVLLVRSRKQLIARLRRQFRAEQAESAESAARAQTGSST